jgi:hypothetical protein
MRASYRLYYFGELLVKRKLTPLKVFPFALRLSSYWNDRRGVDRVVTDKAQRYCPRLERLAP